MEGLVRGERKEEEEGETHSGSRSLRHLKSSCPVLT